MLFVSGYDGHVRAYDTADGTLLWDYYFGSAGYENPYGTFPVYSGFTIADDKLYITNDEHSPDGIPWRGGKLWCFDVFTGDLLWSISGKLRMGAISNGYYTTLNSLDGQIYTFGKGSTATTVSAPQIAASKGTAMVIIGAVTDQSPGAKGTPAISDNDMTAWMEYLYEQKPMPTGAVGVQVKLTAIDPNGNYQDIGTATTDIGGSFGMTWTPPVEGQYHITATFEGTNSYFGSFATTYLAVGPAAAAPQPTGTAQPTVAPTSAPTAAPTATVSPSVVPEPEAAPSADMYIIAAAAAVIIVVVAAVFLKKRK
jgi:outer membrane protein assembly factor BamB